MTEPEQPVAVPLRAALFDHRPTLVMEDETGDLLRCTCGFQEFDFAQGKEAFAKHLAALAVEAVRPETDIDEERLARALREVQPPDPIWAENAAAASGMTVNWNGWAAALIAAYRATPLAERP